MLNTIIDGLKAKASALWGSMVDWPRTHPVMSCLILACLVLLVIAVFKK